MRQTALQMLSCAVRQHPKHEPVMLQARWRQPVTWRAGSWQRIRHGEDRPCRCILYQERRILDQGRCILHQAGLSFPTGCTLTGENALAQNWCPPLCAMISRHAFAGACSGYAKTGGHVQPPDRGRGRHILETIHTCRPDDASCFCFRTVISGEIEAHRAGFRHLHPDCSR